MNPQRPSLSHPPTPPACGRVLSAQERHQVAGGFLGRLIKGIPSVARKALPIAGSA